MKKLLLAWFAGGMLAFPSLAQEAGQRTFQTPEEGSRALVEALSKKDEAALTGLVGKEARAILTSGDAQRDAEDRQAFLKAAAEKVRLVPVSDSLTMMVIGTQKFPVPIPLVKAKGGWYFDGALGLEEVRARRIGRNELAVIRVCQEYAEAQREYARMDPDATGMAAYAERFASSPGKHDGLYWKPQPGEAVSPLGPLLGDAAKTPAEGGQPFHGYHYRILTGQGPAAPGGAFSYLVNNHMVAGFAMVAYPAKYGETGIMTFLVGPNGAVYEKDLKEQTAELGSSMKMFDPDTGWKHP